MYGCTICFAIGVKGLSAGVVGFSVLITVVEWLGRVAYTLEGFYLFFSFRVRMDRTPSLCLAWSEGVGGIAGNQYMSTSLGDGVTMSWAGPAVILTIC